MIVKRSRARPALALIESNMNRDFTASHVNNETQAATAQGTPLSPTSASVPTETKSRAARGKEADKPSVTGDGTDVDNLLESFLGSDTIILAAEKVGRDTVHLELRHLHSLRSRVLHKPISVTHYAEAA